MPYNRIPFQDLWPDMTSWTMKNLWETLVQLNLRKIYLNLTRIGIFCWKRIRAVMCETASLWRFLDDWSRLHAQNLAQFVTQCKIRKDFFFVSRKGQFFLLWSQKFFRHASVPMALNKIWIEFEILIQNWNNPINYMEDTDIQSSCCLERDCLAKK